MLDTAARSLRDVIGAAEGALADAGCDTPRLDAELLLCEALGSGWSRSRLVTSDAAALNPAALARFETLLARRLAREPMAYILGRKAFRGISLAVDRRVLIPRPETELLVEVGLTLPSAACLADIGTGSGAVALALKDERPDLQVTGIDISTDALAVARGNGSRLGLSVGFVEADLLDDGTYQAVMANLPYIADGVARELAPEIRCYEPTDALFAGNDGLEEIRRLADRLSGASGRCVKLAALEVAPEQASIVAILLQRTGFRSIKTLRDLAGRERVVVGRR